MKERGLLDICGTAWFSVVLKFIAICMESLNGRPDELKSPYDCLLAGLQYIVPTFNA